MNKQQNHISLPLSKSNKVISLSISLGTYSEFIRKIIELSGFSSYVCVANVHMCIESYWDKSFATLVNAAEITAPDGVPLVKSLKLLYGLNQDRVAGMDLLPDLLSEANKNNIGIFFYGGTEKLLETTRKHIKDSYPNITNANYYSPPFRSLTKEEDEEIVDKINASYAKLVFVVLGCPKQERWMAKMKGRVNACMIGVGGALPVVIGEQKRAPVWMQRNSLEWLFRLHQEPKRLFKRYFVTNSLFIFLIIREFIKFRIKKI